MVYFVSGHRDLTHSEFNRVYLPVLDEILCSDQNAFFMVGVCEGVDTFAIEYLIEQHARLTIVGPSVKEKYAKYHNKATLISTLTYEHADSYMTAQSDKTVAFIKPGREQGHTARNILRRYIINKLLRTDEE